MVGLNLIIWFFKEYFIYFLIKGLDYVLFLDFLY